MKKIFVLLTAMVLSLSFANAQVLLEDEGGVAKFPYSPKTLELNDSKAKAAKSAMNKADLQPGERIMGFYDTDDLPSSIWADGAYKGFYYYNDDDYYASNLFTEDVLENFLRAKITKIRFALANDVVTVYSAFICEFDNNLESVIGMNPIAQVDLTTGFFPLQGWNTVELPEPVEIKPDKWYAIGFEYKQEHDSWAQASYPLVTDDQLETEYSSPYGFFIYAAMMSAYGLDWYYWEHEGQLCVQAICVSDDFGDDDIGLRNLTMDKYVTGTDEGINYSFQMRSYGNVLPDSYKLQVEIDGEVVDVLDTPIQLTASYQTYEGVAPLPENINTSVATHTLKVSVIEINGDYPDYGTSDDVLEGTFLYYAETVERQMHLIENYTSIYCGYCPLGHSLIEKMQTAHPGKYSWVCMHGPIMGTDPYILSNEYYLESFFDVTSIGYPVALFSRMYLENPSADLTINYYDMLPIPVAYESVYQDAAAGGIDLAIDAAYESVPAFLPVDIEANFDWNTYNLSITVSGDGASVAKEILGENVLNVYLTEDNIKGQQEDYYQGEDADGYFIDYTHNNVLRMFVTPYYGADINWTSNSSYSNTYNVTLDRSWQPTQMKIVAFISGRILNVSGANTSWGNNMEAYVNNCNEVYLNETTAIKAAVADTDENAHEVARYSVDGTQISSPVKGVNLVKMSDGSVKKVVVK